MNRRAIGCSVLLIAATATWNAAQAQTASEGLISRGVHKVEGWFWSSPAEPSRPQIPRIPVVPVVNTAVCDIALAVSSIKTNKRANYAVLKYDTTVELEATQKISKDVEGGVDLEIIPVSAETQISTDNAFMSRMSYPYKELTIAEMLSHCPRHPNTGNIARSEQDTAWLEQFKQQIAMIDGGDLILPFALDYYSTFTVSHDAKIKGKISFFATVSGAVATSFVTTQSVHIIAPLPPPSNTNVVSNVWWKNPIYQVPDEVQKPTRTTRRLDRYSVAKNTQRNNPNYNHWAFDSAPKKSRYQKTSMVFH
jgi:hypothetical protein